jgi:hypothetical protein
MKLHALAVAAGIAVITSAAPLAGQAGPVVQTQLREAVAEARSSGFVLQGNLIYGALNDGAAEVIRVSLNAGTAYLIVGVCDEDCSDMDLILSDATGRSLAEDILVDDSPVLTIEITRSGGYDLTVRMPDCAANPCGYGIAIMARRL